MIKTFITVKGKSERCPGKNIKLLPYVLEQCSSYLDITVITDDLSIKRICDKYNVNCFIEDKSVQTSEFNSIYNYLVQTNQLDTIKEFVHLPVTQPIRNNETIMNVAYSDLTEHLLYRSAVIDYHSFCKTLPFHYSRFHTFYKS